jgi:hypothetical protein
MSLDPNTTFGEQHLTQWIRFAGWLAASVRGARKLVAALMAGSGRRTVLLSKADQFSLVII